MVSKTYSKHQQDKILRNNHFLPVSQRGSHIKYVNEVTKETLICAQYRGKIKDTCFEKMIRNKVIRLGC